MPASCSSTPRTPRTAPPTTSARRRRPRDRDHPRRHVGRGGQQGNLVEIASVPATEALDGSTGEGEAFKGSVAKTTIYQGEQLLTQKFGTIEEIESDAQLPIPAGLVGYPLVLDDQQRISGYTQPGSRVGAIITGMFDGTNVESRLLLDEVNIFATGAETITPVTQPDADDPNADPPTASRR